MASDTVCFPAKLTHGHVQDLAEQGVDRIFMPMVMEMPPDDRSGQSNYVCAVLKGYPLIVDSSESPEKRWQVPFDHPMFHWYHQEDRLRQIRAYFKEQYGLPEKEIEAAYRQGERALLDFHKALKGEARAILDKAEKDGTFAVVLAGRPYHNDPLVSHDLSRLFTRAGVPVLTVDSLPELSRVDLRYTRAEVTNNFHTRMLSGAMLAANSLNIRVQSFLETVTARRARDGAPDFHPLGDAYPAKFQKADKAVRTVLVPNVSQAFCRLLSGVLKKDGLRAEPLPLGSIHEIQLGKKYVHNDTCFPAQMVIGEAISALQSGRYDTDKVAVAMAKYQGDCRLSHYSALLRRGLDAAGFRDVPIVSTDPVDTKEMHPGVRMGACSLTPRRSWTRSPAATCCTVPRRRCPGWRRRTTGLSTTPSSPARAGSSPARSRSTPPRACSPSAACPTTSAAEA